jgi:hypothetical protein
VIDFFVQVLVGDVEAAVQTQYSIHSLWRRFGGKQKKKKLRLRFWKFSSAEILRWRKTIWLTFQNVLYMSHVSCISVMSLIYESCRWLFLHMSHVPDIWVISLIYESCRWRFMIPMSLIAYPYHIICYLCIFFLLVAFLRGPTWNLAIFLWGYETWSMYVIYIYIYMWYIFCGICNMK